MLLVGRNWEVESGYRYGFNTQEQDDEVYGNGNLNTAEFWEYDTRLGRRWNIDPKFRLNPFESGYIGLSNNPLIFKDPKGDIVEYANLRSRVSTFLGRIANKNYRQSFKVMKRKEYTIVVHAEGKKGWSEESMIKYDPGNSHGFVAKDQSIENVFHIYFRASEDGSGSSKYASLYEESFHLDDALGGDIFGGTNKDRLAFTGLNGKGQNTKDDSGHAGYAEVDAWIWRADFDKLKTAYMSAPASNGQILKFEVKISLMQQIHNTKAMNNYERREFVYSLLYGSFTYEFENKMNSSGEIFLLAPQDIKGPYNKETEGEK